MVLLDAEIFASLREKTVGFRAQGCELGVEGLVRQACELRASRVS